MQQAGQADAVHVVGESGRKVKVTTMSPEQTTGCLRRLLGALGDERTLPGDAEELRQLLVSKEAEWVAKTRASTGIGGGLDAEKAESLADAGAREQERELQHLRAALEQGAGSRPVTGKRQVAKVSLGSRGGFAVDDFLFVDGGLGAALTPTRAADPPPPMDPGLATLLLDLRRAVV